MSKLLAHYSGFLDAKYCHLKLKVELEIECDDSEAKWAKRGYNKAAGLRQRDREVDIAADLFEMLKQAKGNRFGILLKLQTSSGNHANMVLWTEFAKRCTGMIPMVRHRTYHKRSWEL